MGLTFRNWSKRLSSLTVASVFAFGILAAAAPVFLTQKAEALSGTSYSSVPLSGWTTDRMAPSGDYTVSPGFSRSSTIKLGVVASAASTNSFYQYEGIGTDISASKTISADLYVNTAEWSSKTVRVGFWGVGYDNLNNLTAYPIVEFDQNYSNANHTSYTGWRVWNSNDGSWNDASVNSFNTDAWNNVEIAINKTDSSKADVYVNGIPIGSSIGDYTESINHIILNNFNSGATGNDYTVNWSNIQTGLYNPNAPTGLQISKNGTAVASGSSVGASFISGNVVLDFNAVPGANQYITEVTYPGGSADLWNGYNNTWLVYNGSISQGQFGQHGDGIYSYKVKTRDGSTGLWSDWSNSVSLNYDSAAPTITSITANGNPVALDGSTIVSALSGITFNVKAADPAGYGYTYVELNTASPSFDWKAANNGAFDTTLVTGSNQYTDGSVYGLKICPTDKIGNGACTQVNFTVDNTRPVITFTNPSSFNTSGSDATHAVVIGGGQTLGITASDANGISGTVLHVYNSDDTPALFCPLSSTNATTCDLSSLSQGNYYVKAGATDTAGNNQTITKYFTIDSTKPTVKINLSRQSYLTNGGTTSSIQVPEIEAFDTHLSMIQVLKSGTEVTHWDTVTPGVTTYKKINWLGEGTYVIRAYDTAGNVSDDFTVIIDNTAPHIPTNGQPSGNSYLNSNVFNYTWSNESTSGAVRYDYQFSDSSSVDNTGALSNVTWSSMANGSSAQLAALSAGPSIPSEGTGDGHHYWQVRSVDAYGNLSSWSTVWDFVLDSQAPSIPSINAPLNEQYFRTSPITNSWSTSTDSLSGVAKYQIAYQYDDGHVFAGTNTCSGETLTIGDGSKFIGCRDVATTSRSHMPTLEEQGGVTIWVRAIDVAGNTSSWSTPVHYYFDATAPVLTYVNYSVTADGVVPAITSDDASALYQWTANPLNPTVTGTTISDPTLLTPTFTVGEDGHYIFWLTATDLSGNISSLTFEFDVTTPTIPETTNEVTTGGQGAGDTTTTTSPVVSNVTTTAPAANAGVLGASTTTPSTTDQTKTDQNQQVLGDSTNTTDTKKDNKGGLAWYWWLLIAIGAIFLGWLLAFWRSRGDDES